MKPFSVDFSPPFRSLDQSLASPESEHRSVSFGTTAMSDCADNPVFHQNLL